MKNKWIWLSCLLVGVMVLGLALVMPAQALSANLTDQQQLGKDLFFDENLSLNENQSCASCHGPNVGWTGPDPVINMAGGVYEGSIPGAFGNRKPPSAAYAGGSPVLYQDDSGQWFGGMFWDGRATGWTLGDPLAEQAKGPFLNPKEMAVPDAATLVAKVQASSYADLFASECPQPDVEGQYDCIGMAIAAFERTPEVSAYTSKFDSFWTKATYGKGLDVTQINEKNWMKYKNLGLDTEELKGLALFNTRANCSNCHTLDQGPDGFPVFTDFSYDNLGIPKNPLNPATIADPNWADPGLGGFLQAYDPTSNWESQVGKFKVPTLRNVDLRPNRQFVKAYGHNAYFKSLKEIVHFYNTRDTGNWPPPETPQNMNTTEVGNLGLTSHEEDLIVSFLKTLSDGWKQ